MKIQYDSVSMRNKIVLNVLVNSRLTDKKVNVILYAELSFVPHHTPVAIALKCTLFRILLKIYQRKVSVSSTFLQKNTSLFTHFKRCMFLYFQLLVYILHTI